MYISIEFRINQFSHPLTSNTALHFAGHDTFQARVFYELEMDRWPETVFIQSATIQLSVAVCDDFLEGQSSREVENIPLKRSFCINV